MGKAHSSLSMLAAVLAGVVLVAGACAEPVHDQQVKALGDDPQGIPDGEYHRAGQPCLTCHSFYGPATQRFAVAGTIFAGPKNTIGTDQVTVELVDAEGSRRNVNTNCVGNFYVKAEDWDPGFPLRVWVRRGGDSQHMLTQIAREGSCSQCHKDPASFDSPGHVHLYGTEPTNVQPPECPFSAISPTGGFANP
jgi:hypothetical protein